jgi:hypothetical protein
MSSFYCEKCGKAIMDSEQGYTTGCKHYPMEKLVGWIKADTQIYLKKPKGKGWFKLLVDLDPVKVLPQLKKIVGKK